VSGQKARICVRTKDSYLCPDKRLVFVTAIERCTFRTHKFAETQMLREVLVFEPRDFRLSSMCVNHVGAMFGKESAFALLLND
jgi:hypothetical protein